MAVVSTWVWRDTQLDAQANPVELSDVLSFFSQYIVSRIIDKLTLASM
jgi:hypothetical protein